MLELAKLKEEYEKVRDAYNDVNETGYGIVMPTMEELTLEEPEIIKPVSYTHLDVYKRQVRTQYQYFAGVRF